MTDTIIGTVDLASVSLYLFWIFFAALIYYLQTENAREGYPLVNENDEPSSALGLFSLPRPKTFRLPHGRGEVTVPDPKAGQRPVALERRPGPDDFPFDPTGDPMVDGVGPASWAPRRDKPELDGKGHPKIVPFSAAAGFHVSAGRDPRGLSVVGADKSVVGTVSDMWIDETEQLVRYLEVDLEGDGGRRLMPMPLVRIRRDHVTVHALYGKHFAGIPTTKSRNQVTLLEEEKICAYFAGGKLYASEDRQEPLI